MATQSVDKSIQGPVWNLGLIIVATAGTPVRITSLVDLAGTNAPETASGAASEEYSPICQQICVQGFKAGAGPPALINNTGNIYLMRTGAKTAGAGNAPDFGVCCAVITPGQTLFYASAPLNRNQFSPYNFYIDADTSGDSALVSVLIG